MNITNLNNAYHTQNIEDVYLLNKSTNKYELASLISSEEYFSTYLYPDKTIRYKIYTKNDNTLLGYAIILNTRNNFTYPTAPLTNISNTSVKAEDDRELDAVDEDIQVPTEFMKFINLSYLYAEGNETYKGIGTELIKKIIKCSFLEGFEGKVQVEISDNPYVFYAKMGFEFANPEKQTKFLKIIEQATITKTSLEDIIFSKYGFRAETMFLGEQSIKIWAKDLGII